MGRCGKDEKERGQSLEQGQSPGAPTFHVYAAGLANDTFGAVWID
jgi:hypothetical protein